MPRLARLQSDLKTQPPIRIDRRLSGGLDGHAAPEIGVSVGRLEALLLLGPVRGDPPAPHNFAGFDLENVGEIASNRQFELKPHVLAIVIGDVEVFVHSAVNRARQDQPEGALRNFAVLRWNPAIRQVNPRGVIGDRSAIQQLPAFAIRVNRPTADDPRIQKVEAMVRRPLYAPVVLGDENGSRMVNGDLRGTDLYFEGHGPASFRARLGTAIHYRAEILLRTADLPPQSLYQSARVDALKRHRLY